MLKYIAKRLAVGAFTLFLLATVTFFLMHVIPGSPFAGETSKLPAKVKERLYEKYGLDKPVSEQYVMYLKNAAKGDFGVSIYRKGKSIDKIIKNGLPYTMRLGAVSITFALVTGIFLGTVAAFTKKKWLANLVLVIARLPIVGAAAPSVRRGAPVASLCGTGQSPPLYPSGRGYVLCPHLHDRQAGALQPA